VEVEVEVEVEWTAYVRVLTLKGLRDSREVG
jgi:hypothetical protein